MIYGPVKIKFHGVDVAGDAFDYLSEKWRVSGLDWQALSEVTGKTLRIFPLQDQHSPPLRGLKCVPLGQNALPRRDAFEKSAWAGPPIVISANSAARAGTK